MFSSQSETLKEKNEEGKGGEKQRERDREIKKRLRRERGRIEEMGKEKTAHTSYTYRKMSTHGHQLNLNTIFHLTSNGSVSYL